MDQTELTEPQQVVSRIIAGVANNVYGHRETLRLLAGAFIIGGMVLIEGPPGIAKTRTARCFARTLGLKFSRIQFTPDLMPSDITGVSIFDQKNNEFRFVAGPIFAEVVLADEINRTPPKTQAALLEAMEERRVTVDGTRYALDEFFWVIATQNPIEHEGTYPLPEAQLDRFMFKLKMGYPDHDDEVQMVGEMANNPQVDGYSSIETKVEPPQLAELRRARAAMRQIIMEQPLVDYIVRIVTETRKHPDVLLGASPRAALHLALAAKMNALIEGRLYAIPDDVKEMVPHVLGHRIIVDPLFNQSPTSSEALLNAIMDQVAVPERSSR